MEGQLKPFTLVEFQINGAFLLSVLEPTDNDVEAFKSASKKAREVFTPDSITAIRMKQFEAEREFPILFEIA